MIWLCVLKIVLNKQKYTHGKIEKSYWPEWEKKFLELISTTQMNVILQAKIPLQQQNLPPPRFFSAANPSYTMNDPFTRG